MYYKKTSENSLFTVAFYNVENLFDTYDDPLVNDDAFLPNSVKKWTVKRYNRKLFKIATTLSNIGFHETRKAPVIIGLAEVENRKVLEDLLMSKHLKNKNYGIAHVDSPDERGIDVALLYAKEYFTVTNVQSVALVLTNHKGNPDYTRDILWVTGLLNGENVHILVNHWSSRREGEHITVSKRIAAARKNREIIDQIKYREGEHAKIIVMGDFNDDPHDISISKLVQADLYNPMDELLTKDSGTTYFKGNWNLFDQLIFSNSFHKLERGKHSFMYAKIFAPKFLKKLQGRYKGKPYRTYVGRRYQGGYSDHFPIYTVLKKY